ncbi:MAG TPA: hypothetical protein VFI25_11100 [Planctomycetota bacterium]|jgi:hypothetical protein|nr:hypothetical protein [Planctomycetota bacterium]
MVSLERLQNLVDHFEERERRAADRLASDPGGRWHFGLIGLDLAVPGHRIGEVAVLRPVVEPPGEVELAGALQDKGLMSAVGRYSHFIRHELAVDRTFGPPD